MAPATAQIASGKFQGRAMTAAVVIAAIPHVAVSEAISLRRKSLIVAPEHPAQHDMSVAVPSNERASS
jgi:hypothetical protein